MKADVGNWRSYNAQWDESQLVVAEMCTIVCRVTERLGQERTKSVLLRLNSNAKLEKIDWNPSQSSAGFFSMYTLYSCLAVSRVALVSEEV